MMTDAFADRRRTARIPTGTPLLHRAVGMHDFAQCEVTNVTTSGIELLADRPIDPGTLVTLLVRQEGSAQRQYRVVGFVQRRQRHAQRWLHVLRSSSRRPWSPMLIYDLMFEALSAPARLYQGQPPADQCAALTDSDDDGDEDDGGDAVRFRTPSLPAYFVARNERLRDFLTRQYAVTRKPTGTTLIQRGSRQDLSLYLLDGTLCLEAFDGRQSRVAAGERRAELPIALLRPHACTVRAASDVALIMLNQEMLRCASQITVVRGNNWGIEVRERQALSA